MNIAQFLKFGQMYSNMGHSVQQQFRQVVAGGDMDALNPNALKEMVALIEKIVDAGVEDDFDIKSDIEEHLKELEEKEHE